MAHVEGMRASLRGIAVGDAFGFKLSTRPGHVARRELPEGPWYWSDDTAMALSVVAMMEAVGRVDQDMLFDQFVKEFAYDPRRGYGSGMKKLLGEHDGRSWRERAPTLFRGQGSLGNGAAMRVPPLGAYLGDDLALVAREAARSAEITHAHPEGIAGAVAVACAAGVASRGVKTAPDELIAEVLGYVPEGEVKSGIERSRDFAGSDFFEAARQLGNGSKIMAADTVPLCVWWAAHNLDSYEEAMWALVEAKGDEDTTCAIVGGILGAAGAEIPEVWIASVEDYEVKLR